MPGLELLGIRAVAEGVPEFVRDLGKMRDAEDDTTQAASRAQRVWAAIGPLLKVVAQGIVAAAAAAAKCVLDFQAYAESVGSVSRALEINADAASRVIQVSDDFGISQEQISTGLRTMLREGIVPSIEGLAQVSDHYLSLTSSQERAEYANRMLGRQWMDWTRLLEASGDTIRQMAGQVPAGLILSDEDLRRAEEYRMELDQLNDTVQALKISIGRELLPVLLEAAQTGDRLITWNRDIEGAIRVHGSEVLHTSSTYQAYIREMGRVVRAAGTLNRAQLFALDTFERTGVVTNEVRTTLLEYGVVLDENAWTLARSTEGTISNIEAVRLARYAYEEATPAIEETTTAARELDEVHPFVEFTFVSNLSSAIDTMRDDILVATDEFGAYATTLASSFVEDVRLRLITASPEAADAARIVAGMQNDAYLQAQGRTADERRDALLDLDWTQADIDRYMADPMALIQAYMDANPVMMSLVARTFYVPATGSTLTAIPRQLGGPLGPLTKVGEKGWEYIFGDVVIPHSISVMLERLGILAEHSAQYGANLSKIGLPSFNPQGGFSRPMVAAPAVAGATTNNYTLNIATSARAEPIAADFKLLASLRGR